ncbi:MAG: hypothetical protein RIC55_06970 [Pirellulaceae bacterium]
MSDKSEIPADTDVMKASRPLRIRMLLLFAASAIVAAAVVFAAQLYVQKQITLSSVDPLTAADNVALMVRCLTIAFGVGLAGFAAWFGWLGACILRTGQYPPPGLPVIRDTRIRRGHWAKCTAVAALLYCALLLAVGTYGAWRFDYAVRTFVHHELVPLDKLADRR